jgi:hypothetical protein
VQLRGFLRKNPWFNKKNNFLVREFWSMLVPKKRLIW